MRKEVENELKNALYDYEVAKDLFKLKRYNYVAFTCQQAVEKILKAAIIKFQNILPPKEHNLRELARCLKLRLPKNIEDILTKLNPHYLISRYTDAANGLPYEMYNKEMAQELLKLTEEALNWFLLKIKKN